MSKLTSICGVPREAGGMPSRLNSPSSLLPAAISRSPWNTLIVTAGWLSSAVEKVCANLVGIVVFFVIILVITPPMVSMPSDSGVTSSSSTSLRSPREHLALDGGADGHGFVGVHVLARLLAEELLDLLLHLGHAGHAADQDHVADVGHADAGILDGGAAGRDGALDQLVDQRFRAWRA